MPQIVLDFILATLVISCISILMARHGMLPNPFAKKTTLGPFEDSEKKLAKYNGVKHSGALSEKDGLPSGFTISYSGAWQQPILGSTNSEGLDLPKGASFVFITIKFGNGKVVINPKTRQVAILGIKDLKVLVKDGEKIKVLID